MTAGPRLDLRPRPPTRRVPPDRDPGPDDLGQTARLTPRGGPHSATAKVVTRVKTVIKNTETADPPLARFLFSDTRMSVVWFVVRLYVGFSWLEAGLHKVLDSGATSNYIINGAGLLSFWQ